MGWSPTNDLPTAPPIYKIDPLYKYTLSYYLPELVMSTNANANANANVNVNANANANFK